MNQPVTTAVQYYVCMRMMLVLLSVCTAYSTRAVRSTTVQHNDSRLTRQYFSCVVLSKYDKTQYSTVQYGTAQYSTVQHSTAVPFPRKELIAKSKRQNDHN